jgi:RNA polymerase sigma factor (sigma-70 family)
MDNQKNLIDKYYVKHYDALLFATKKNLNRIQQEFAFDILTMLYLHLIEKKSLKFDSTEKFFAYCILWIVNNIKFPRTPIFMLINNTTHKKKGGKQGQAIADISIDNYDYIELSDNSISEEEQLENEYFIQNRINQVYATVSQLPRDEQILFNLVFVKGLSSGRKLAKHLNISASSGLNLIKGLKQKLKNDIYLMENNNSK